MANAGAKGRPIAPLVLSPQERTYLERQVRRHRVARSLSERCRAILRCADGLPSKSVAAELGLHEHTVGKWRRRFLKIAVMACLTKPALAALEPSICSRTVARHSSSDPLFVDKVRDIVGLYLSPPNRALVLSIDEKSQIQGEQPVLPMMPGVLERRTHGYVRHGTTSLFAALDVASGLVIGKCYKRHRAVDF